MGERDYTLERLARAVGMTPRNIRAYQTRGLLPRPVRNGRVATYGEHHVVRLKQIQRLREIGVPLRLIAEAARRGDSLGEQGLLLPWAAGRARPATTPRRREVEAAAMARLDEWMPGAAAVLLSEGMLTRSDDRWFAGGEVNASWRELRGAGLTLPAILMAAAIAAEAAGQLASRVRELAVADGGEPLPEHAAELLSHLITRVLAGTLPGHLEARAG